MNGKSLILAGLIMLARQAGAVWLTDGWRLQSSCEAAQAGPEISSPQFEPRGWHRTSVPSTVLAALVADKTYPDPYYGMNLRAIPGADYPLGENFSNLPMSSTSPFRCSWWYRKEFALPPGSRGKRVHLRFDGINYRANLWLNGRKIADASDLAGAWRRYELDVTTGVVVRRKNVLAAEVFAPGENDLAVTWVDWNPAPPDKDMGLFGSVALEETGPVSLRRPVVFSALSEGLDTARLSVETELVNASALPVEGVLTGAWDGRSVSQQISLAPGESRLVRFSPDRFPALVMRKPRVWWPYQMGAQPLYSMKLSFKTRGAVSDAKSLRFGIRRVETEMTPDNAVLFKVNGRRVLIRGGGWASDMMLRQSRKRLGDELSYVQALNLNTIRLEGKLETDDFFDEADRRGILVMAGWSCCDAWERWKDWKEEQHRVAAASLEDQIARLRAHPSILAWLNGSDNAPPQDVEEVYLGILKRLEWPNAVLPSASDQGGIAGKSGVKMEGPYDYVPPGYWLSDTRRGGAFGFDTEVSPGPAMPTMESLRRMFPIDHLWPADSFWSFHAGGTEFAQTEIFDKALESRYGKPRDLADYDRKSQAMAYEGERAMFEAFARNKYRATGVVQWMLNNAWPSTIWHLYDYFLVPGGGFFGARAACEPVHVQYSYDDGSIVAVNGLYKPLRDVRVGAKVYDLSAKLRFVREENLDLAADESTRAFVLPELSGLTTAYFLKLSMVDTDGKPLSDNLYWLSTRPDALDWEKSKWYVTPQSSYADYSGLETLPPASLKVSSALRSRGQKSTAKIVVRNVGRAVAFMIRLRLTEKSGQDVAPVLWSDNYFTLLPGESKTVTGAYDRRDADGTPGLEVGGWNAAPDHYALAR